MDGSNMEFEFTVNMWYRCTVSTLFGCWMYSESQELICDMKVVWSVILVGVTGDLWYWLGWRVICDTGWGNGWSVILVGVTWLPTMDVDEEDEVFWPDDNGEELDGELWSSPLMNYKSPFDDYEDLFADIYTNTRRVSSGSRLPVLFEKGMFYFFNLFLREQNHTCAWKVMAMVHIWTILCHKLLSVVPTWMNPYSTGFKWGSGQVLQNMLWGLSVCCDLCLLGHHFAKCCSKYWTNCHSLSPN